MTEEQKPSAEKDVTPVVPDAVDHPQHDPHLENLVKIQKIWKHHGNAIVIGVALAVVIYAGITAWFGQQSSSEERALGLVTTATNVADLEAITTEYADTPAATVASLSLAGRYFQKGRYVEAQDAYAKFIAEHPDHVMATGARLGQISCIEALGRYAEALTAYTAFAEEHPDYYLYPQAVFGSARCQELLGKYDEARTICEDFMAAHPDSRWMDEAESELRFIEQAKNADM